TRQTWPEHSITEVQQRDGEQQIGNVGHERHDGEADRHRHKSNPHEPMLSEKFNQPSHTALDKDSNEAKVRKDISNFLGSERCGVVDEPALCKKCKAGDKQCKGKGE